MAAGHRPPRSGGKRLLWFAALWAAGVVVVAVLAYGIRMVIAV